MLEIFWKTIDYAEGNNWQEIMKESEVKYDIRPYKISSLGPREVAWLYNGMVEKQSKKDLRLSNTYWQENQRRIFVWFLIFYFHMTNKQPISIKVQEYQQFSSIFFQKTPQFLEFHCKNIIKSKKRPSWSQQQDQLLINTIKNYALGKWNEVAKEIFFSTQKLVFRTPKQCRQRWYNHLDTSKERSEWTDVEDIAIISYVNLYGKKWARIVKQLNHKRTEHMIKNRYNSLLRKYRRYKNQTQKQIFKTMVQEMKLQKQGLSQIREQNQYQISQVQTPLKTKCKGFQRYIQSDNCPQESTFPGITQEQFSLFYNINILMYQNWIHQCNNTEILTIQNKQQ